MTLNIVVGDFGRLLLERNILVEWSLELTLKSLLLFQCELEIPRVKLESVSAWISEGPLAFSTGQPCFIFQGLLELQITLHAVLVLFNWTFLACSCGSVSADLVTHWFSRPLRTEGVSYTSKSLNQ